MRTLIDSWKKKANRYQELKKQKGVTLLEIIIVLGIIGIIAAGVVVLAQRAFTSQDISNVIDDTNSVRVAMTEAYKDSLEYPALVSAVGVSKADIKTVDNAAAIVALVKMGKISPDEAFNGFSNDAFEIGHAKLGAEDEKFKGFYLVLNGLETEDCRNIISQVGAQWDYVATVAGRAGDDSAQDDGLDMSVEPAPASGILKSTTGDMLNPTNIVAAGICDTDSGAGNAIVLGSR